MRAKGQGRRDYVALDLERTNNELPIWGVGAQKLKERSGNVYENKWEAAENPEAKQESL
jgi:hypothetical protein